MEYSIIIHKDEKSGWYTGQCIQIPGALSQGKTLDELMENMKDAISLMIECNKEDVLKANSGHKVFYRKIVMA